MVSQIYVIKHYFNSISISEDIYFKTNFVLDHFMCKCNSLCHTVSCLNNYVNYNILNLYRNHHSIEYTNKQASKPIYITHTHVRIDTDTTFTHTRAHTCATQTQMHIRIHTHIHAILLT